ncbi:MAG TPA: 30S ribosomal protein S4 [Candidatus Paceibacterota bacterium]|nr:30S ribosomal protein S4 [Candidatus Paceibacterota bacterium]
MLVGPKYKICKRLGASVFEKCQTQRFQVAEARAPRRTHAKRGGGGDYGAQLLEKQKARFTYGLTESQFSRYVHEAMEKKGKESTSALVSRLESRLDNVVYRSGLVRTRRAARQLVSHGHVTVNGRRMTVPSHAVVAGDTVGVRQESRGSALFANRTEQMADQKTPHWMKMEEGGMAFTVTETPRTGETEAPFNPAVIIQFYSR